MSQMCDSIDTLSMAYLDCELAPEEKRELELHLLECQACRDRVAEEAAEAQWRRQVLAAPPTPDLLRAKLTRMLDREDKQATRLALRERLARWLLPGTAMTVAAAAMLVFVFLRQPSYESSLPVGRVAQLPMSVTGVATGSWVEEQINAPAPSFGLGIDLIGGRLAQIDGRRLVQLVYGVNTTSRQRFEIEVFLLNARGDELRRGQAVRTLSGRDLYVVEMNGLPAITYIDDKQIGYVFLSRDLSERALLHLVLSSDLIDRAASGR